MEDDVTETMNAGAARPRMTTSRERFLRTLACVPIELSGSAVLVRDLVGRF